MKAKPQPLQLEHPDQLPDRRPLDKYRTPEWVTLALIESYPELRGDLLIDPCAGDSRMPRALLAAKRFDRALVNDIDQDELCDSHYDAASAAYWAHIKQAMGSSTRQPWAVSNTPFLTASQIAYQAIQAVHNVALLLRATWLEPTADRQWLGRFPPKAELVLPRFGFIGAGTSDTAGCRWLLWGNIPPGIKVWTGEPGQSELAL